MIIRGILTKIDLGEVDGKVYGDIRIETEEKSYQIRYPLGSEIGLPRVGSEVEAEVSGEQLLRLERLTVLQPPREAPAAAVPAVVSVEEEYTVDLEPSETEALAQETREFGVSRNPVDWVLFGIAVVQAAVMINLGEFLTHCTYYPEYINSIRDTYILTSFGLGVLVLLLGASLVLTVGRLPTMVSLGLSLLAGTLSAFFWSTLVSGPLLMYDEEQLAEAYMWLGVTLAASSFVALLYFACKKRPFHGELHRVQGL
jgi:hypothetical protein